jgi:imidazolonepropionase-like amidohydrolase
VVTSDPLHGVADGPEEAIKAVRLQMKFGAQVIKICATGGVLSEGDAPGVQQMSAEEIQAVVHEAHQAGRKVAAHAHGTEGILAAVRGGVDSIEHGTLLDDEGIRLMKEKGTFLVPTLSAGRVTMELADRGILTGERAAKARTMGPRMGQSLAKAMKAGVKVALGTDAGVGAHGTNGGSSASWWRRGSPPCRPSWRGRVRAPSCWVCPRRWAPWRRASWRTWWRWPATPCRTSTCWSIRSWWCTRGRWPSAPP